jgi:predicted AAA+ superfamily ATPase
MMRDVVKRMLPVPEHSFFLFGARGTGKSTWLRARLPEARYLDLLDTSLQLELSARPERLEALLGSTGSGDWVILDEVQKIPLLLDEVHRLMETNGQRFALCGSSARKLKRGGADLLAGRAITLSMEPFSAAELGDRFDLDHALEWGGLPVLAGKEGAEADVLAAYVATYLREEIKEEGAVRNFAPFARFLEIAGQLNGQVLNAGNVSREAQVPRSTVEGYFELLRDTLLGFLLPAYRPGLKVREAAHPKFFWVDPGIARGCAGLLRDPVGSDWRGAALETLLFHELRVYNAVSGKHRPIRYYRTAAGVEIDFVVETRKRQPGQPASVVCIEVKHAERWQPSWEKPMRSLAKDQGIRVEGMFGVYRGRHAYRSDGLTVLPVEAFLESLFQGGVF